MKKKSTAFQGQITHLSSSPHGDPEGVVLNDGTFVKIPPHSLLRKELIEVGAEIEGEGERLKSGVNPVFHHAKITVKGVCVADDAGDEDTREDLKEQHKRDLKKRKDAPSKKVRIVGAIVAIGVKPKGEVDRFILEDGTSVHVPKDLELESEDFEIGEEVEVRGEARQYPTGRFLRAEAVSTRSPA